MRSLCGARVFLTGHTGFKGAWAVAMLRELGAEVTGFSLPAPTVPSLFEEARIAATMQHEEGDVRHLERLSAAMQCAQPDLVIHMAAQSLVIEGLDDPVGTFATNVQGTVHVLEAIRTTRSVRAAVIVTSDKCYEPSLRGLHESDPLGGHDPYSGSKAAAEIVVESYREAFFRSGKPVIASVRAGNVIGGGDWSHYRIVADLARAMLDGRRLTLRHPNAIRPWQHVADALNGYFTVAARALQGDRDVARAWNFGPSEDAHIPVRELVERFARAYGVGLATSVEGGAAPENPTLILDSGDARRYLGWRPKLDLTKTIDETAIFYRLRAEGTDCRTLLQEQVRRFLDMEMSVT